MKRATQLQAGIVVSTPPPAAGQQLYHKQEAAVASRHATTHPTAVKPLHCRFTVTERNCIPALLLALEKYQNIQHWDLRGQLFSQVQPILKWHPFPDWNMMRSHIHVLQSSVQAFMAG